MEEGGIDVRAERRRHDHEPGRGVPLPGIRAGVRAAGPGPTAGPRRSRRHRSSKRSSCPRHHPSKTSSCPRTSGGPRGSRRAGPTSFCRSPSITAVAVVTPLHPMRESTRYRAIAAVSGVAAAALVVAGVASGGGHAGRPTESAQAERVSARVTAGWRGPRRAVAGPAHHERRRTRRDHVGAERGNRWGALHERGRPGGSGRVHGFAGRRAVAGDDRGALTGADGWRCDVRRDRRCQRFSRTDRTVGAHRSARAGGGERRQHGVAAGQHRHEHRDADRGRRAARGPGHGIAGRCRNDPEQHRPCAALAEGVTDPGLSAAELVRRNGRESRISAARTTVRQNCPLIVET